MMRSHARIGCLILQVELPQQFEDAILESISVKQNITRTLKTKNVMEVQFSTQIMASKQMANQTGTRRSWLPCLTVLLAWGCEADGCLR